MTEDIYEDYQNSINKEQVFAEEQIDKQLFDENDVDEVPDVQFDLVVTPSDPPLEVLSRQLKDGDLIVPFYQRKYVWKIEQASRLVESFLIGLPVPQVFFYVNDEGELEIIDGQQRILSISYFLEGYFGEPDANGNRKVFKLKGLSDTKNYNGKAFTDLDKKDQRKLKNSTLRAINIRQLSPNNNNDCVFHIFQRLNTGGTQLKPQEIRNAVYRGKIVQELQTLNSNKHWMNILGFKQAHKNQRDIELLLRLVGLFRNWNNYERPMLSFLNDTMYKNREFNSEDIEIFKENFHKITKIIDENIEKPFRPKGVINTAMLDAVFIALLENNEINVSELNDKYQKLITNAEFIANTFGPTADTAVLKNRITIAKTFLG
ncbi:DUF262 domain-containing protein [Acinetobacter sp. ANC 4779]|uniref:GmrSD restriction endonuclease domain-containing protein n=1 Tax=Acinetobacter sp. ANC 4779 TaxID=2529848 RepID=UPI00103EECDA|nr:DUF262 domain-containing protein [Acinetobacter sp. ANC 4779]TCB47045.1 DUF262 domain-containing protein [Acinetobacter sp. ANC 4779]